MNELNPTHTAIIATIEHWVSEVVVRHRFCPFAKPALEHHSVSYCVLDGSTPQALLEQMAERVSALLDAGKPDATEFAETSPHSIENYTNRAPWPVLQLLQVDSVSRALDSVANPEQIPQRNIEHLNSMDDATADQLMRDSVAPVSISGVPSH